MNEKTIFVSFDMGIKGDYPGLYTWLDKHNAKECVNGLAAVKFAFNGVDLIDYLEKDMRQDIQFSPSDRIYVIWKDDETGKFRGRFLIGTRKRSPWEGYAKKVAIEDVVE